MPATQTLAAHPRIERRRGFGGEVAMVAGTRLPVFLLLHQMRSAGWDEAEVIQNYPQLSPEQLHAAREYGRICPQEVAADEATYDASLLAYGG